MQDFRDKICVFKPLHDLFLGAFYEQHKERKSCWSQNWQLDLLFALSNRLKEIQASKKHYADYWTEECSSHRKKPLLG